MRRKFHQQFLVFFSLSISWINLSGQEKTKADRYVEVYKNYLDSACPVKKDSIKHFVYFSRDREAIKNHPLLTHPMFEGAQIMYAWRDFETVKGKYDFSMLTEDYEYLKKYGKKLFLQLQDVTFNPNYKAIPDYLLSDEYNGGAVMQYNDDGSPGGWVAKRWNEKVRERFALLLLALGREFDGKIEGINLQETAIGVGSKRDASFTDTGYVRGLKENMLALKKAFPVSTTMIYANFIPGEWLPWEDKGYLRSIYQYGEQIGVGLGGPDLMVTKKPQLNHALAMMHEGKYTVPLGIAIQDGNYVGETGNTSDEEKSSSHENIVPLLHAFAKDFLKINYMFWVNEDPYFKTDVLSCFSRKSYGRIEVLITKEKNPKRIYSKVNITSSFYGGDDKWIKNLEQNINRNLLYRNGAEKGKYIVTALFVVDNDGNISDVRPDSNIGYGMEEAVLRALKKGPKWLPAVNPVEVKPYRKSAITLQD